LAETRERLSEDLVKSETQKTCAFLINMYEQGDFEALVSYMAMASEINLNELHEHIWKKPEVVYCPKVKDVHELVWGAVDGPDDLEIGAFNVPEPTGRVWPFNEVKGAMLVIVPGLGFTRQGGRIGWGAAYYDRVLPVMKQQGCTMVGVGFSTQLCEEIPEEKHDVRLENLLIGGDCILS
jgi:5-formyltetrahydrofolate cyclo-ligase